MNRFEHQWQKLVALARQADVDRPCGAPYGFATRVAARLALGPGPGPGALFERFALRGLLVAAAFGAVAVAFSLSSLTAEPSAADVAADTIGDLVDLS